MATSPSSLACSSKTVSKTKAIFSSLTEVVMFSQSHIQQQSSPVRLVSVELSSLEAVRTNGRRLRAAVALWDLLDGRKAGNLAGRAPVLEPKVTAGSKFKAGAACSGGCCWLDLPSAWLLVV